MTRAGLRTLYAAFFLGVAVLYYYFFGPGPTLSEFSSDLPWWRPAGWALRWAPVSGLAEMAKAGWPALAIPLLVFCIPPIGLIGAGVALFRSAWIRAALLALGLSLCLLVVYGYVAQGAVWHFFSWRFLATAVSFSAIVGIFVFAPSLLLSVLALPRALAIAILLAVFAGIFLLSTEITGTDSTLRANLSPWPALTLFGFLLFGYCLAALHVAAASGVWLHSQWRGARGRAAGIILAALAGAAFASLVFDPPGVFAITSLGLASALYALVAQLRRGENQATNARLLTTRLTAGVLMASFIFVSNRAAISYLQTARNKTSAGVIAALDEYRQATGRYPDELSELVPRFLPEVPQARMGLIRHPGEGLVYTNFGDSYALEFASVQWVQCAYSPPYAYDDEEKEFDEESWDAASDVAAGGDPLTGEPDEVASDGNWSCESTPPQLW